MTKKFILNADDFGMNRDFNTAVYEGYNFGLLKSTSLVANGNGFEDAINRVVNNCSELGVGVHLNIMEGKSLCSEIDEIANENNDFINSYGMLILKSFGTNKAKFLKQVEWEFSAQIEKVRSAGVKITHLDSHVHTHAIPPIFELVCKLAKQYGINHVRTQYEKPYFVPDIYLHLNPKYPLNLIKIALLDGFTLINKKTAQRYDITTNDYLIGVGYTSMMNSMTVFSGLESLRYKHDITVEALIHPCRYDSGIIDNHFTEYRITQNEKLMKKIEKMGYEITNYKG